MDFHLATEPPSRRGDQSWAHAVPDGPQPVAAACGTPMDALVDWPDLRFPDIAEDTAYCMACAAAVDRERGQ